MTRTGSPTAKKNLARQVREQFVAHAASVLASLSTAIAERLMTLVNQSESTRDAQHRRDAMLAFQNLGNDWTRATVAAWRGALVPAATSLRPLADTNMLELISDDEVENKILASRLTMGMMDKAGAELNDLRVRIQTLESTQELASQDILRPEVISLLTVEQWAQAGLLRPVWAMVQDVIQQHMAETITESYRLANQFLISQGVQPEIDLKSQIRRAALGGATAPSPSSVNRPDPVPPPTAGNSSRSAPGRNPVGAPSTGERTHAEGGSTLNSTSSGSGSQPSSDDNSPMSRARVRAQGLLGQIKRALGDRDEPEYVPTQPQGPSAALVKAMDQSTAQQAQDRAITGEDKNGVAFDAAADGSAVVRVASNLRERTTSLKKQASTNSEKATIEIVALMFQSILAEERIPAAIRVWFARLQMPVMRVALFEPEFFSTLHHPARKLIDHMGSCVLGFDSRTISGSALETEIKRIVQVIEQYPDTGRRVFQLVYDEFQKFLSKFLTEKGTSQRVVTLAQQVEQKETLAIQYTIEMRNMLNSMPVRDEIREFLFKVWAEVLAVAAIKNGAQHDETIMLKRSASDLVWAASAKPNRGERARVIQDLPNLLHRLRQGMSLLGFTGVQQESHIKIIGDTLADAFLSKTESIPQDRIDAMAERLAHLEDFVIEDGAGDIPLDAASIEMLVGIDASSIVVVADGGSKPSQAMMAWAQELQPGTWYTLDHNNDTTQVQFVWRSDRKQLHLFASADGHSYLIQARRLAAYLQAGLLVPQEDEALTVRASRNAMEKIDANPERLLS